MCQEALSLQMAASAEQRAHVQLCSGSVRLPAAMQCRTCCVFQIRAAGFQGREV
jgi:hypothetical protein